MYPFEEEPEAAVASEPHAFTCSPDTFVLHVQLTAIRDSISTGPEEQLAFNRRESTQIALEVQQYFFRGLGRFLVEHRLILKAVHIPGAATSSQTS